MTYNKEFASSEGAAKCPICNFIIVVGDMVLPVYTARKPLFGGGVSGLVAFPYFVHYHCMAGLYK